MAQTDEDLIARIAAGDSGAMQALYARHSVRIYRFIMARSRNATRAEELTHEAFLEIWRSAARCLGGAGAESHENWNDRRDTLHCCSRFDILEFGVREARLMAN